jgi:hypothetical protein
VALAWLASGRFRVQEWLMPTTLTELPAWFARTVAEPDQKGAFKLVVANPGLLE